MAEYQFAELLDQIFGGVPPEQTVTWEPNTNPGLSQTEGLLSGAFRESTRGSAVISTGNDDFFSYVYKSDGGLEKHYHFDTDGDGGADILYRQIDGTWERAEYVDAVGKPIWVPSNPPDDEREKARRQDGE